MIVCRDYLFAWLYLYWTYLLRWLIVSRISRNNALLLFIWDVIYTVANTILVKWLISEPTTVACGELLVVKERNNLIRHHSSEISTRLYYPDESSIFQTSVLQMIYLSMCNLFYYKVLHLPYQQIMISALCRNKPIDFYFWHLNFFFTFIDFYFILLFIISFLDHF